MKKNKIIAAIVTTLILFAIIRSCSPTEDVVKEPAEQEETWDPSDHEAALEEPQPIKPTTPTLALKPKQPLAPQKPTVNKVKLQEDAGRPANIASFSQKSDSVFFKIKDGLALVGGDVIIGELSSEQKKKTLKGGC